MGTLRCMCCVHASVCACMYVCVLAYVCMYIYKTLMWRMFLEMKAFLQWASLGKWEMTVWDRWRPEFGPHRESLEDCWIRKRIDSEPWLRSIPGYKLLQSGVDGFGVGRQLQCSPSERQWGPELLERKYKTLVGGNIILLGCLYKKQIMMTKRQVTW